VCHQTVRCANGATAKSRNGRLQKRLTEEQSRRVRGSPDSEQDMSGVAPDCPVPQEDNGANGQLLQNPNGWVTWRRTRQPTVPVRCAHRQLLSPTASWWLRAINTPSHHNSKHPSLLKFPFNTRASAFTPRHK
jgi:hypothetical protein